MCPYFPILNLLHHQAGEREGRERRGKRKGSKSINRSKIKVAFPFMVWPITVSARSPFIFYFPLFCLSLSLFSSLSSYSSMSLPHSPSTMQFPKETKKEKKKLKFQSFWLGFSFRCLFTHFLSLSLSRFVRGRPFSFSFLFLFLSCPRP